MTDTNFQKKKDCQVVIILETQKEKKMSFWSSEIFVSTIDLVKFKQKISVVLMVMIILYFIVDYFAPSNYCQNNLLNLQFSLFSAFSHANKDLSIEKKTENVIKY